MSSLNTLLHRKTPFYHTKTPVGFTPFRDRGFCVSLNSIKILATFLVFDKLATSHAQDIHKLLIIRRFVFRMYVCPGYQFITCMFPTPYLCVFSCNLLSD